MSEAWDYDVTMNGREEVTTTRAYRGTHALEIETFAVNQYKSARWGTFFDTSVDTGDLYIRVFYWLSSSTVFGEQASLLSTGNSTPPYPSTFVMFTPSELYLNVDSAPFGFTQDFPRDRWVCVEQQAYDRAKLDAVGSAYLSFEGEDKSWANVVEQFIRS